MSRWDRAVVWIGLHPETAAIAIAICAIGLAVSGGISLMRWLE